MKYLKTFFFFDKLLFFLKLSDSKLKKNIFFLSILYFVVFIFDFFSINLIFSLSILILYKKKFYNLINNYDYLKIINNLSYEQIILTITLFIVFFSIIKFIIIGVYNFFKNNYLLKNQSRISCLLLEDYLARRYSFFLNNNSGKLITNIKSEVERTFVLVRYFFDFCFELIILIIIFFIILFYNFFGSLIFILFILFFSITFSALIRAHSHNIGRIRSINYSSLTKYLIQTFLGIKFIKISKLEKKVVDIFKKNDSIVCKLDSKYSTINNSTRYFFELLLILSFCLLVLFFLLFRDISLQLSQFIIFFAICAFRALPAISKLHTSYNGVVFYVNSLDNIYKEFKNKIVDFKYSSKINNYNFKNLDENTLVNFNNVSFKFSENKTNILENLNFEINIKDKIAILGKTGSGKSTVVDLLVGLLFAKNGIVELNKKFFIDYKRASEVISFAPQTPFLIEGTILDNIVFGSKDSYSHKKDKSYLDMILKIADCHKFISEHKDNLYAHVGENGIKLSVGQKQRVAVARALFKREKKIIILDEPTSSLDAHTSNQLINNIIKSFKDIAIVVITHKIEMLRNFNKIYFLKNKRFFLKK